ncbi:hypothetical protein [Alkalimarinus alittae]|uniref:Uncharacterized protein n=1 Tax=Alkalimarinus alittae TaxID=2961619 RepID=A0ABY6MZ00_9ALTE|nr:hypothetical protein [Alkalimarinus alittae]UZE95073.1 hypothetical protein NKI27_13475 [Alkalimarinus alittae]
MLKWLLLLVVGAAFVFWLKRGKKGHDITDPEVKEIDQQRYYVNPPDKNTSRPKDNQGNDL